MALISFFIKFNALNIYYFLNKNHLQSSNTKILVLLYKRRYQVLCEKPNSFNSQHKQ